MQFDLENPFSGSPEDLIDTFDTIYDSESEHMPCEEYIRNFQNGKFDVSDRQEAISEIQQFSCNFIPHIPYLAVNYFDRFVSTYGMAFDQLEVEPILMLQHGRPGILKLVSMSCLSLAAKMMKNEFSLSELKRQEGFIFDSQSIQRMELLILGSLKWRIRSITPFAFVDLFVSLFKLRDARSKQALNDRATEILLNAQNEINILEFKPSTVAASALLYASETLFPLQFRCYRKAISPFLNEDKLSDCRKVIQGILVDESSTS